MAGLDDTLSELDKPTDPQPKPQADQAGVNDTLRELDGTPNAVPSMAAAQQSAAGVSPDMAAKAAAVARRAGINPAAFSTKDFAEVQARFDQQSADLPAIQEYHKQLADWLSDPTHAAIGKDDVPNLRALSTSVQAIQPMPQPEEPSEALPWLKGVIAPAMRNKALSLINMLTAGTGIASAQVVGRDIFGITGEPWLYTPLGMFYHNVDRMTDQARAEATYAPPDAMRRTVGNLAGMVGDLPAMLLPPLKGAQLAVQSTKALDAAIVAGKGLSYGATGILEQAGSGAAAAKGAALVMGEQASLQTLQDIQNTPASERAGALANTANAAVQGALGYLFGRAFQHVGPLRQFEAEPWSADPIRDWLTDFSKQTTLGATQNVLSTGAQDILTQGRTPTASEALESGVAGGLGGAAFSFTGAHEAFVTARHMEVLSNAAVLQDASKLAQAAAAINSAKSAERSPQEVALLIDQIAGRFGNQSPRFLQAEEFDNHMRDQGKDPLIEAERAGLGDAYREATDLNARMALTLRQTLSLIAESKDPNRLATQFRPSADAPNAAEAARFFQDRETNDQRMLERAKVLAAMEIQPGRGADDPRGQMIHDEVRRQFLAAGESEERATNLGDLTRKFFGRLADMVNDERAKTQQNAISPTDLYDQFRLRIVKALPDILRQSIESGGLPKILDTLRTAGPGDDPMHHAVRSALTSMGLDPVAQPNVEILRGIKERVTAAHKDIMGQGVKPKDEAQVSPTGQRYIIGKSGLGSHYSETDHAAIIDSRIPAEARLSLVALEHREAEQLRAGVPYAEAHKAGVEAQHEESRRQGLDPGHVEGLIDNALKEIYKSPEFSHSVRPEQLIERGVPKNVEAAGKSMEATEGKPLGEGTPAVMRQGERGAFSMGHDLSSVIELMQGSNESTALHELGHFFRGVLSTIATRPDAPQKLKDMYQTMLEWSGYGTHENMLAMNRELADLQRTIGDKEPTAEQSERMKELSKPDETFAKGWERYVMEGVAPSIGLRRVFGQFMQWSKGVYKDVRALGVEISPAMRDVFDRLLASERELANARHSVADEAAFKTKDEMGATDAEWASYQALLSDEREQEAEALRRNLMDIRRRAASQQFKDERAKQRAIVEEQVGQEKVYQAITALQDGRTWDGREIPQSMKIDRAEVEKILGKEDTEKLPGPGKDKKNRGRSIFTSNADNGARLPDNVAPELGYAHGEEMLRDMIDAEDREARIDRKTDAIMADKLQDPMKDPELMKQEGQRALHDHDVRTKRMDIEREHTYKLLKQKLAADEADFAEAKAAEAEQKLMEKRGAGADSEQSRLARLEKIQRLPDLAAKVKANAELADIQRLNDPRTGRPERKAIRVAANDVVARTKLSLADYQPDRFQAGERHWAIKYAEAMAKKDYVTALDAKRRQMMNAELMRSAQKAQDVAARDRKRLYEFVRNPDLRAKIGKAGGYGWSVTHPDGRQEDFSGTVGGKSSQQRAQEAATNSRGTYERFSAYIDQIDQLLERYDLKQRAPGDVRKRQSFADWLQSSSTVRDENGDFISNGSVAHIPESILNDVSRQNWRDMSIAKLHDLRAAVDAVAEKANLKYKLMTSTGATDLLEKVKELVGTITANAFKRPRNPDGTHGLTTDTRNALGSTRDILIQIPRILWEMDGFKNAGPVQEHMLFPFAEASDKMMIMRNDLETRMKTALDEHGSFNSIGYVVKREIPGVDRAMSMRDRIVTLMHYGNPEGRQRLLDLNRWDDGVVHKIVDGLSAKDIKLANDMVDILGSHWSDIKAMEEKYNGIAPRKVESIPVELPNGTYKGGYQRIYYVGDTATTLEHLAQQTIDGEGYRQNVHIPGYTKERAQAVTGKVLDLGSGNWNRHINEMTHDLTHRDAVLNQLKTLTNKDLKASIIQHWGAGVYQQMINQARGLAGGDKVAVTGFERGMEAMRIMVNYSHRGLNPMFAVAHLSGFANIFARVPALRIGAAQAQMSLRGPWSSKAAWIHEQSATMRFRNQTRNGLINHSPLSGAVRTFMDKIGMWAVTKIWEHLDNVAWSGAYDQHMSESGNDHATSVRVADQIVESLFGSRKQKDMTEIERMGGVWGKMLTSSMSYDIAVLNGVVGNVNRVRYGAQRGDIGHILSGAAGAFVLAALSTMGWDYIYDTLEGKDMAEWKGMSLAKKVPVSAAETMMRGIPIARDLAPAVTGGHVEGFAGAAWVTNLQKAIEYANEKPEHKTAKGSLKAYGKAAGDIFPTPTSQVFRTWDGIEYSARHRADLLHQLWFDSMGPPAKK